MSLELNGGLRRLAGTPALRTSHRSGRDHLVPDFYEPCLSTAIRYDRAVGYFSSGSLVLAAKGVHRLLQHGGHMRLVASPVLEHDDATDSEVDGGVIELGA